MGKKALIFIENYSFTYDKRVIREANALIDNGWDITVISPKYPEDPFYKKLHTNLRAYYYPKLSFESITNHIVEGCITLSLGALLTFWVYIKHGFDIFHACNPMDILWLIALPYKLIGKKFIFDQHDLCPELCLSRGSVKKGSLVYKLLAFLEKYSYKSADAVLATNESYKEIAIKRGGKRPEDVFVVRNGPDLKKFKKATPNTRIKEDGDVLVGYLGNMNPQDGVDYLLEAAYKIVNRHERTNIKFVLVGGGMSQPSLSNQSRKMGLENNVIFTGRIPDGEMLSILNACDICVQPDPHNLLNDISTMNKVLEYMALEKPVIAFDLKETRISCGNAALYVMPNNTTELAEKILYLAKNSRLRTKMGRIGRERVEKRLSWNYSIPSLLAAYKYVMQ